MKAVCRSMAVGGFLVGIFFLFAGLTGCSSVTYRVSSQVYDAKYKVSYGNLRGSLPSLEKALKLNPRDLEANVTMAQVQYRLGNLDKAEKYAETAHAIAPNDFRALGILGLINLRKGQVNRGIERMARAIKIYNGIEPVGGNVPVEPTAILKDMRAQLKRGENVTPDLISQLEGAFWRKIQWYEFDEEYRKWHFYSFYDVRPDGGNAVTK